MQRAAAAATQPLMLTGLPTLRISRNTTAASAVLRAPDATLNISLVRTCLRPTARTKASARDTARHEQPGGQEHQPQEHRYLFEDEEVRVPAIVQGNRCPHGSRPEHAEHREHLWLGYQDFERASTVERTAPEQDRGRHDERRGVAVDGRRGHPAFEFSSRDRVLWTSRGQGQLERLQGLVVLVMFQIHGAHRGFRPQEWRSCLRPCYRQVPTRT